MIFHIWSKWHIPSLKDHHSENLKNRNSEIEMKVKTIQILWHNKQPIYTADFEPAGSRLATGGADSAIRVSCKT